MAHVIHTHPRRHGYIDTSDYETTDDRNEAIRRPVGRTTTATGIGGINFSAAFYGWLVAAGLGALMAAIVAAIFGGAALVNTPNLSGQAVTNAVNTGVVQTSSLLGGIVLLVVLAIAYYAGGYVAGRLARYDGAWQGLGAWLVGIIVAIILAIAGAALGARFNVLQGLSLPSLPLGNITAGSLGTSILTLAVTLVAALAGGKAGESYHQALDVAAADDEYVEEE
jgi:hypothetical protein